MTGGSFDFLVIIATYRRPEFLGEAIASALSQSGATKTIIVVDDCPDGSARKTIEAIGDPAILYLQNPRPSSGGPSRVRNFGFAEAGRRGIAARFVHFLDDDDVVPEGHYAAVKAAFDANPDAGVVFGNLAAFARLSDDPTRRAHQEDHVRGFQVILDATANRARAYRDLGAWLGSRAIVRELLRHHALFGPPMFYCGCCIIRHEVVSALGGFAEDVRLTEDLRYFGYAVYRYGAVYLDRIACRYRTSDTSLTRSMIISPEQAAADGREMQDVQRQWQRDLQRDLGPARYYGIKVLYKLVTRPLMDRVQGPMAARRGKV